MCGAASAVGCAEVTLSRLMAHACVITPVIRVTPWVSGRSSRLPLFRRLETCLEVGWQTVAHASQSVPRVLPFGMCSASHVDARLRRTTATLP
jgi:hypothetical protein